MGHPMDLSSLEAFNEKVDQKSACNRSNICSGRSLPCALPSPKGPVSAAPTTASTRRGRGAGSAALHVSAADGQRQPKIIWGHTFQRQSGQTMRPIRNISHPQATVYNHALLLTRGRAVSVMIADLGSPGRHSLYKFLKRYKKPFISGFFFSASCSLYVVDFIS